MFSVYTENKILDLIATGVAWTPPSALYLALFTSAAGLENNTEGEQTEVTGGSYARIDASTCFGVAANGTVTNSVAEIIFPTATAEWGTVTHAALMDAATSGNVLVWGTLSDGGHTINIGDGPRFLLNDITLSVD